MIVPPPEASITNLCVILGVAPGVYHFLSHFMEKGNDIIVTQPVCKGTRGENEGLDLQLVELLPMISEIGNPLSSLC